MIECLHWEMFYNCNYNCSYCYEKQLKDYDLKKININSLKKTAQKIKEFMKYNNICKIGILGGEVFILKKEDFIEILNILNTEELKEIEIVTNLSKPIEYYIDVINIFKNKKIILTCSFHYEQTDIHTFLSKIFNLKDTKALIQIQLTLFNKTKKFVKILQYFSKKIKVKVHFVKKFDFENGAPKRATVSKNPNFGKYCEQSYITIRNNKIVATCFEQEIVNDFLSLDISKKLNYKIICKNDFCTLRDNNEYFEKI